MDPSPSEVIKQELLSWKGVTIHEHNFVTIIFYVRDRDGSLTWRFDSRYTVPYKS